MRARPLAPRRLATALLLVLFLLIVGVGAAGLDPKPVAPGFPPPAKFTLPQGRVGDFAHYAITSLFLHGDTARTQDEGNLTFEWLAPGQARDADGLLHDVHRVMVGNRVDARTGTIDGYAWALDRNTGRTIALQSAHEDSEGRFRFSSSLAESQLETRKLPCPVLVPWQGKSVPMDGAVLWDGCAWDSYMRVAGPEPFEALASQQLGGFQTVLMGASAPWGATYVWLTEAFPYPVRVALHFPRGDAWRVYSLSSYATGTEPLAGQGRLPGQPAAPLVEAPWTAHGPDASGIVHPFKIQDAVAAAAARPNGDRFSQVLKEGYLAEATLHSEIGTAGGAHYRQWAWRLVASDGVNHAAVVVTRRIADGSSLAGLVPSSPGQDSVTVNESAEGGHFPLKADLPQAAPTVASLWARWADYAGPEHAHRAPNHWGFRLQGLSHGPPMLDMYGGFQETQRWSNETLFGRSGDDSRQLASVLRVSRNPDGVVLSEYSITTENGRYVPPTRVVQPAPHAIVIHQPAWLLPSASVLLSTGVAAVIAGLAYLLGPALKSGLVGLFSREVPVQRLLEHPLRRRLADLASAEPGIHAREAARRLGASRSQLSHHLAKLEAAGVLRATMQGGYLCIVPAGADPGLGRALAALKAEGARAVLEASLRRPGVGPRDVARELGMSSGTVSYHVRRLRAAGLLEPSGGLRATARGHAAAPSR